jgi:energy-coupling factor transporter ATP-binding protein EcfA2
MTEQLIYLVGQPGSGKSTLMAKLTAQFDRHSIAPAENYPVAHDVLTDKKTGAVVAAEIGKRRELFSGTDALASSVIDKAAPWIASQPYPLVLAEGARLANKRFLEAALAGGYHVTLVLLDHADAEKWRAKRSKEIGKEQNAGWVKGRLSASRNLADQFANLAARGSTAVTVLRGHPAELEAQLRAIMAATA